MGAIEAIGFFLLSGVFGIFSALLLENRTAALYQLSVAILAVALVALSAGTSFLGMAVIVMVISWTAHIAATLAFLRSKR